MKSSILFLVFNRPDTTARVFEAIRQARPLRLYIAADGPREGRKGETEKVAKVREIATAVDWPCEVKKLFQGQNLGCKYAVSGAINWFFESEEQGIILEDDCLPHPSFFRFCEELLERYRDESQVMMISGNYFAGEKQRPRTSYYFSRYPLIWGWATWRRAWELYDRKMVQWPQLKQTNFLRQIAGGKKYFINYWSNIFDMVHAGKIDTWDYQFIFAGWVNHTLSIVPYKNLVKNIGFGIDGTHTFNESHWRAKLPLQCIEFPLIHPKRIERNVVADRLSDKYVFDITLISFLKLWIIKQPGGEVVARIYRYLKSFLRRDVK